MPLVKRSFNEKSVADQASEAGVDGVTGRVEVDATGAGGRRRVSTGRFGAGRGAAERVNPSEEEEGVRAHEDGWVMGEPGAEEKGEDPADEVGESGQCDDSSRSAQGAEERGRAIAAAATSAMLKGTKGLPSC